METLLDNLAVVIVLGVVLFVAAALYEVGKRAAAKLFGWSKDEKDKR